jgi:glutamate dehydrogenase
MSPDALAEFAALLRASAVEEAAAPADLAILDRLAAAARDFVGDKPPGAAMVRIVPAEPGAITRTSGPILQILNDDMPFLVDTVAAELHARGIYPDILLHPTYKASRDAAGRLTKILRPGDADWADRNQESFITALLPRLDPAAADSLVAALRPLLEEVRSAVRDWRTMLTRFGQATDRLSRSAPRDTDAELVAEIVAFCRWLIDGHFIFLGMREYRVAGIGEARRLESVKGTGLGLLGDETLDPLHRSGGPPEEAAQIARYVLAAQPLILTKSNLVSRVHRRTRMDYVGLKTYEAGQVTGELRVVGLLTSAAYTQPPAQIPLLRRKVERVTAQSGYAPHGHNAKALTNVLDTFPRDELFRVGETQLLAWARIIVDLGLRPRTRVLCRWDRFERFVSVLVFLPRERYSGTVRENVGNLLAKAFAGAVSASVPYITDAPVVRIHFVIDRGRGPRPNVDEQALEAAVDEATRPWSDRLSTAIAAAGPALSGLTAKYVGAFPPGYVDMFPPSRAIEDIARIERLGTDRPLAIDFYREAGAPVSLVRAALYRFDMPVPLSERVPVLENLGFRVIDERSYHVTPHMGDTERRVVLHDMVLEAADGQPVTLEGLDRRLEECFLAVFGRAADNDGFNRLVMLAGADWREAAFLRTLGSYLRQIGAPFSPTYVAATLARHSGIARDLIELFRTRHDPDLSLRPEARSQKAAVIRQRIDGALEKVQSLDEDRIVRRCLGLTEAILRTNYFQRDADGASPAVIAIKLDSRSIDQLPEPRPYREIFMHSPRVEGVHLRFGAIARGGIRWSDRPQDFRTEVLGLAKAQVVKNTVIVPTGSKGGFVPRMLRANATRDEAIREGITTYQTFIATLLSITDNIVSGRVVPPPRIVRHDGDDPYFVVAADKGTATFSDYANAISVERGFWLGDAFASGGSAGYDHKKMGITARGAWVCVERHFRELDIDIATMPFRVVGVGDMSGDVFGNGMLLSPEIRLIAAFDHRDIFLDPNPDPAASLAERRRLFDLPRSSWQDYDKKLLSKGGGIFPRSSKSIPLSPEVRKMLRVDASSMTPAELISTILRAETDLLWFGGIGTFIRATNESDESVGDRANDSVRITAAELRTKAIGEGANLGITQRARVEAAQRGIKLNADFIDNSAGVNTSDQEVNIKIALGPAVAAGRLGSEDRERLLASMTNDVAAACLLNNYQQSLAISLAERTSARNLGYLARLMDDLEQRGLLDRRLEAMPTRAEIAARQTARAGMTRPEIAALLSYAKIALDKDLLAGPAPSDPALKPMLVTYFPPPLRERFADDIAAHPLAREIVATRITNSLVNRGGPAMVVRLADETGRSPSDIAIAAIAAREILALPSVWDAIDAQDGKMAGDAQLDLYAATQHLLIETARDLLRLPANGSLSKMIERYQPTVRTLISDIAPLLTPAQKDMAEQRRAALADLGLPPDQAMRFATMPWWRTTVAVPDIAPRAGAEPRQTARMLLAATQYLRLTDVAERAAGMATGDYYDRLAINGALSALDEAARAIAVKALAAPKIDAEQLASWVEAKSPHLAEARARLEGLTSGSELTVARLTVGAQQVRDLSLG